jgi:hypothetical protein
MHSDLIEAMPSGVLRCWEIVMKMWAGKKEGGAVLKIKVWAG